MRTDLQAPAAGLAGVQGPGRDAAGVGLDAIAAAMAAAGIARATVDYHGWRDGGTVDVPAFVDAAGAAVEAPAALRDHDRRLGQGRAAGGLEGRRGLRTARRRSTPPRRRGRGSTTPGTSSPARRRRSPCSGRRPRRGCDGARDLGEGVAEDDRLDALCAALRALGVAVVRVDYCGYGDEGYAEDVQVEPEGVALPDALRQQVEDWACERLPAGWEVGAGSQGSVTIRVDRGRARFDHEDNTERTEDDPFTID